MITFVEPLVSTPWFFFLGGGGVFLVALGYPLSNVFLITVACRIYGITKVDILMSG
jgi:hypothetical protein